MIDWTVTLSNLTPLTIFLVVIAGSMLGLYFGALNQWKRPSNIISGMASFIIIGWSFYLPLGAALIAEGRPAAERVVGSMLLWVVFTFSAAASNTVVSLTVNDRRMRKLQDKMDNLEK